MASRRIVILGGTQAGPTAAARAREVDEDADITIIQRGAHLGFGFTGLHHLVSGEVTSTSALDQEGGAYFERAYGIRARLHTEAIALDLKARTLTVRNLKEPTLNDEVLPWDSFVFALGARSVGVDGVKGRNVWSLRTLADAEAILAARAAGAHRAVVVGGGSFGLEAVDGLNRAGFQVTLLEAGPSLLPRLSPHISVQLLEAVKQVATVHLGVAVTGAVVDEPEEGDDPRGGTVRAVTLKDGRAFEADIVIVCAGVKPRTDLLRQAGVALEADGTVAVDRHGAVGGVSGVYAVGASVSVVDAIIGKPRAWAQAAIADKVAQVVGTNAVAGNASSVSSVSSASFGGFAGTLALRVANTVVGRVGLDVDEAIAAFGADDVDTSLVPGRSHEAFFPSSTPLGFALLSQRSTGRVLGASVIGATGAADKRLDVVATAILGGLTVAQLQHLDLAAMEAAGLGTTLTPAEVFARTDWQVVDVRGPEMGGDPGLDGATRLDLQSLRRGEHSLDAKKPTLLYDLDGRDAWLALRILRQKGFDDVNIVAGGLGALRLERPRS